MSTLGSMSDPENLVRTLVKFGMIGCILETRRGEPSRRILDVFPILNILIGWSSSGMR